MTRFQDLSRAQRQRIVDAGVRQLVRVTKELGSNPVTPEGKAAMIESLFVVMMSRLDIEVSSS